MKTILHVVCLRQKRQFFTLFWFINSLICRIRKYRPLLHHLSIDPALLCDFDLWRPVLSPFEVLKFSVKKPDVCLIQVQFRFLTMEKIGLVDVLLYNKFYFGSTFTEFSGASSSEGIQFPFLSYSKFPGFTTAKKDC